jgi:hypothetical protein
MIDFVILKLVELAAASALHATYEEVITHRQMLSRALSAGLIFRNRKIRVSMAEILRLPTDGGYVLIQSSKHVGRFTPIGGVVRCWPSGLNFLREQLEFEPQYASGEEKYDLRGFLRGKNFPQFLKWYYTEVGREKQALSREIFEELRDIGLRSLSHLVKNLEFRLVRIIHEGPVEESGKDYWQYRLFLVKELESEHGPSKQLADMIVKSVCATRKMIVVTPEQIRSGQTGDHYVIGDSAGYLFGSRRAGARL